MSASPVSGTFSGLAEGASIQDFLHSGLDAQITYTGGDGNDVVLTVLSRQPDIAVFNGASTAPGDARTDGAGSVSFGSAIPGSSVVRTFTLKNTGAATLSGLTLTKTGDVPGHYTLGTLGATTLAWNASTTFTVTFAPQVGGTGTLTAGLQIGSDDPDENPFDIALTGSGPSAGSVDLGLNAGSVSGAIRSVAAQPDGKALLGGQMTTIAGTARRCMARLSTTGAVDSFDPSPNDPVLCQAVQADGKVLLGGYFNYFQPNGATSATGRYYFSSVNANGTLDSLNPRLNGTAYAVLPLTDGKILIGGEFTSVGTTNVSSIARLTSSGTVDSSFNPSLPLTEVRALAVDASGRILVGGGSPTGFSLYRLLPNGTIDSSFAGTGNGIVAALTVQADGKILVGGLFTNIGGGARVNLARLEATGVLDNTFNPLAPNAYVRAMSLQADGRVIIGGDFTKVGTVDRNRLARLNSNGTLDTGWNPNPNNLVLSTALQGDGKALVGGMFTSIGGVARSYFARLYNDAATQTLTTAGPTLVNWTRGGSAPEINSATLEFSADSGVTWAQVATGTRVGTTANWTFTGLSLPASGALRARGRTVDANSSIVETILLPYFLASPEIAITTAPGSTNVVSGGAAVDFGSVTTGTLDRVFTVTNTGTDELTLGSP
ncbi:MAG: choice-of-anchor D domain-containing protein, partial [Prosthecobacter sp.]